jgi:DUF1009 family protein
VSTSANQAIGLLAGGGRFPVLFARAAQHNGLRVACVGIDGEVSDDVVPYCDRFTRVRITRMTSVIRTFQRWDVRDLVMAGKVHKSTMYRPGLFFDLLLDPRMFAVWYYGRLRRNKKDDSILLTVIDEFAKDGLMFQSALDYCPDLLAKSGVLTRRKPTRRQLDDIQFGWDIAKEMGRLDVGQSVAVKDCATIAVEAIEGTDRCIERAGQFCAAGGWTLVKVAKPNQDMRFDVPTVGVETIRNLHKAGAAVLAIQTKLTIVVDETDVVALADKLGITIIAIADPAELNGLDASRAIAG